MLNTTINICCFILLFHISAFSQEDSVRMKLFSFIEKAEQFYSGYPDEKVYLHLDNNAYFLGETLRFKAYVVQSPFHQPISQNNILYVELVSPEGNLVSEQKLKISDGQTFGEFQLDTSLYSGFFEIRAYTRTMLRFTGRNSSDTLSDLIELYYPPEYPGIFSRVIPVYDKPESPGDYSRQYVSPRKRIVSTQPLPENDRKKTPFKLTFYPEGGHLVEGITSRTAFKATTNDGKDIPLRGAITTQQGDTVTTFTTIHRGMGTFLISPKNGIKYTASVTINNKEYRIPLPEAETAGYSLQTQQHNGNILIRVAKQGNTDNNTGIAIICRGKIQIFKVAAFGQSDTWTMKIRQELLLPGVNEIILFDTNAKSLCERKIFIRPRKEEIINISVRNPKDEYQPGEKISLHFQALKGDSLPFSGNISVAIRDADTETTTFYNDDILTYLLLSSEIRGFIPDVRYYFEKEDPLHDNHLDLLMRVQGWTRCPWDKVTGKEVTEELPEKENEFIFRGKVNIFSKARKKIPAGYEPWPGAEVSLELTQDSSFLEGKTKTDQNGDFRFYAGDLKGDWNYLLKVKPPQLNPKETQNFPRLRIALDLKKNPGYKAFSYYETQLPEPEMLWFRQRNDTVFPNINLEEAIVQGKHINIPCPPIRFKVQDIVEETTNHGIISNNCPPGILAMIALAKAHFIHQEGYINYFNYKFSSSDVDSIYLYTDYYIRKSIAKKNQFYLLYPTWEYQKTKDWLPDYVMIFTKKLTKTHPPIWGTRRGTISGFTPVKEYYTEELNYVPEPSRTNHHRVLFWNPMLKTNANGQATITFYNNNLSKKIKISAEAIGKNGNTGSLAQ